MGFYLLILGFFDAWKRKVPMWLLIGGMVFGGVAIYRCIQGETTRMECICSALPGLLLLSVARITGKAGYADGIVLIQAGMYMGGSRIWLLFCFSFLLLSVSCVILLLLHKVNKNTRMPYLSFLAVTNLIGMLGGG